MKKYILKEKIEEVDWVVGEVKETNQDGDIRYAIRGVAWYVKSITLHLLLKSGTIEEVKEELPFSVDNPPKEGEKYWYVRTSNNIYYADWGGDDFDVWRLKTNNCFRTEKEAEDWRDNIMK